MDNQEILNTISVLSGSVNALSMAGGQEDAVNVAVKKMVEFIEKLK